MASSQQFPEFKSSVCFSALTRIKPTDYKRVVFEEEFALDKKPDWYSAGVTLELTAASGLGKSSVLPLALARGSNALFILAEVDEFAAAAVHRRVQDINRYDVPTALRLDLGKPFPSAGLVITTAAAVIANIAQKDSALKPAASVLMIDDAFAPLPATSALRRIAPSLSFISVVAMDACTSAGTMTKARHKGKFVDAAYVPESFEDPWSVTERRSPWSVNAMEKHSLILVDSDARASDLMQAYAMNAVPCLRWKRAMTMRSFMADLDYLENSTDRDVVVLAESRFRYAFMIPFGTIIDTAQKDVMECASDGKATVNQLPLTHYELKKGMHRGGHFPGVYTVHWSPKDVVADSNDFSMTATDVDFETLAIAACGFRTDLTRSLADVMSVDVLDDVVKLLNAEVPLSMAGLRYNLKPTPFDDTFRSFGCAIPDVVEPPPTVKVESPFTAFDDLLRSVDEVADEMKVDYSGEHFGKYATVSEPVTLSTRSPLFPNGASSLAKQLSKADDLDVLLGAWDEFDRNVAANLACNSYNAELISVKALSTLIREVKSGKQHDCINLRAWSRDIADDLAVHVAEARRWYATLIYASHDLFPIVYDKLDFSREEAEIVERRARDSRHRLVGGTKKFVNPSVDRGKIDVQAIRTGSVSGSDSSRRSASTMSDKTKSVRFKPKRRISDLPGYNFNDLVVSWVGGRTRQYRRSLERRIVEVE